MGYTLAHQKKDKRRKKQRQEDFLDKLIEYVSISTAAKKAKVSRSDVYWWIKNDLDFKILYDQACELAVAKLEDEAVRRAYEGYNKPVYQGGKKVGTIKEYSDTLLIVLLKARAPEKYKDRHEMSGPGGKDLFASKTDDELKAILNDISTKLDGK